jgi:hypothetical protein
MFPSSPISLAETYTPSSGIRCRRDACALQIVPSGLVFQVGTISLPSGATMRLRRARCLVWLNPVLGWQGYEPVARGMAAALPHIDLFAPAHNLESLAALEPYLAEL